MKQYRVLGIMSGTSMDGVDLALCRLEETNGGWKYEIEVAEVAPYPKFWVNRLKQLVLQNAITYLKTDAAYGHFLGEVAKKFIEKNQSAGNVDFIASHGQTIFHQPENHMTSQIGDGAAICTETGLPVVCNFRTIDIALGGQGTPVAPIADQLLFSKFRFCLNLGGIANISVKAGNRMIGYDICSVNLTLNFLAGLLHVEFDEDGEIASGGMVHDELLEELNRQWYYQKPYPKSLGGGFVTKIFNPLFFERRIPIPDKLRTAVEHIALQIAKDVNLIYTKENLVKEENDQMLVTGGGAFNKFLLERINYHSPVPVVIPDAMTIKFKESLLIALMGALRMREEVNVLSSVTGSKQDNIGGIIYLPPKK